jgi:hypothetical protein
MLWIALAAQMSAAQPVTKVPWFSTGDTPASAERAGIVRRVATRTVVSPDGHPRDCTIESNSGDAALDQYTCTLILKRGRFTPARWIDGSPAYGVDRYPVYWMMTAPLAKDSTHGDVDLMVNRLPEGTQSPVMVSVVFAADESGHIIACDQAPPRWGTKPNKATELVRLACDNMMKNFAAIPPKDADGNPLRSVKNGGVRIDAKP